MNWIALAPFLNSKEESIELFRYLRLYPTAAKTPSYVCSCGHSLRQEVDGGYKCGYRWRCSNWGHRKTINPLSMTLFEHSQLTVPQILALAYAFILKHRVGQASTETGISRQYVSDWYFIFRKVCTEQVLEETQGKQIGGLDPDGTRRVVEIDESHITTRKFHEGRILKGEQYWVFGGKCRETLESFLVRVPDRSAETLIPLLTIYVDRSSIIMHDDWSAYRNLHKNGFPFHFTVVHKRNFIDPDNPDVHTQNIEREWRAVKETIKSYRPDFIDSFLSEHLYRYRFLIRKGGRGHCTSGEAFKIFMAHVRESFPDYSETAQDPNDGTTELESTEIDSDVPS